jgi:putative N6-adenine-specific DNA methylase
MDKTNDREPAPAFAKRLKRRVAARQWDFFAVTAPGLETLCRRELEGVPADIEGLKTTTGGVEFRGRLHDVYAANLHLRTATRILMRMARFRTDTFRALEKKLTAMDWELFLPPGCALDIRVTARHSRLYHSEAVGEVVRKAVSGRVEIVPVGEGPLQRLQLRLVDDRVALSLDTSGDPLYKRGLKAAGGRAPLRETVAAAVLMTADFKPGMTLVDPMCGTGTFSLEGALLAQTIAPGCFRSFAFMRWPAFAPGRWKEALRRADQRRRPADRTFISASDVDPAACGALRRIIEENEALQVIRVDCRDFFDTIPGAASESGGLVVLNPPYGRRLGSRAEGKALAAEIFRKLHADYRGWKLAMMLPKGYAERQLPFAVRSRPLYHGGLKVVLLTGTIQ